MDDRGDGEVWFRVDSRDDTLTDRTLQLQLTALDWDAAGLRPRAREAVCVALDWSDDADGFGRVLTAYRRAGGAVVPAEPWVLGGWVSAQCGWLVHNVRSPLSADQGSAEASGALARLMRLHAGMAAYLDVLGSRR